MSTLQKRLQKKLDQAQINASELERRAKLPLSAARRILLGNTKNPTLETIVSIANVLGCSIDELVKEEHIASPRKTKTDLTFEKELFVQLIDDIKWYLQHHEISALAFNEFITYVVEMYEFSLTHPERKIDKHFVTWYLGKMLASSEKNI